MSLTRDTFTDIIITLSCQIHLCVFTVTTQGIVVVENWHVSDAVPPSHYMYGSRELCADRAVPSWRQDPIRREQLARAQGCLVPYDDGFNGW